MPLKIVRDNIINVRADAIVNTANPEVAVGRGVDFSIYTAAGWDELLAERKKIGPMVPGQTACTPAFGLDARYIIHAIGPAWLDGKHDEKELVAKCYRDSLIKAADLGCGSIAFPLMATGTYGFPKDDALKIAMREISAFLIDHEMEVILVVFDKKAFELSGKLFSDIEEYISDHEVEIIHNDQLEQASSYADLDHIRGYRQQEKVFDESFGETTEPVKGAPAEPGINVSEEPASMRVKPISKVPIEELLKQVDKPFRERLIDLIDSKGLKDPDVYKKANIDRKLFSKIMCNADYKPSKPTALALAIALELNMDETLDLINRLGYTLSPSYVFDLIIMYCIEHKINNIYDINCILFEYDQQTLGQ